MDMRVEFNLLCRVNYRVVDRWADSIVDELVDGRVKGLWTFTVLSKKNASDVASTISSCTPDIRTEGSNTSNSS